MTIEALTHLNLKVVCSKADKDKFPNFYERINMLKNGMQPKNKKRAIEELKELERIVRENNYSFNTWSRKTRADFSEELKKEKAA